MQTHSFVKRSFSILICIIFTLTLVSSVYAALPTPSDTLSGSTQPAAFQNVEYKLLQQDNIVQIDTSEILSRVKTGAQVASLETDSGLTPREIISETGYIQESVLRQYSGRVKPGTIMVDVKNKTALKVAALSDSNVKDPAFAGYTTLVNAAPYEVLEDFRIPFQTVTLNRANITHYCEGMQESLVDTSADSGKTYIMSASTTGDEYSGAALDKLKPLHLKDPFLEFKFDKKKLTGYTPSGGKVEVVLSGYLGLDKLQIDGEYTGSSGYEFYLRTGEEIYLKAVVTANVHEEIRIPILGVDIDAKVARVTGGLFLIVGLDGQFTLQTEVRQWLMIDKAGVHGGTFFYVPTSFKPLFVLGDTGVDGDASFNGAVNGYIRAGPLLELQLFGFDCAGAGALFGGGAECTVNGGYIDADVYGTVNIYAKLMGHGLNLLNWKPVLFHKRQVDTEGYIVSFKEACAYRKTVWARIEYDYGMNGGILPYANSPFQLKVVDSGGKVKLLSSSALLTDSSGNFVLNGIDLAMNDKVYVVLPSKVIPGKMITSDFINPSFPFDKVVIERADYFNDFVEGYVPTTRVKNWNTDKYEEINYTGDVVVTVKNGTATSTYNVKTDKYGRFKVENKPALRLLPPVVINVRPESLISAKISFGGFPSYSTPVTPTVNFAGNRLPTATARSSYDEGDKRLELLSENETFVVYNLNGTKILTGTGSYNTIYKVYPIDNIINPDTGFPAFPIMTAGTRQAAIKLFPFKASKLDDAGASFVINNFNTKWAWAPFPTRTVTVMDPTGRPAGTKTVIDKPLLPSFSTLLPNLTLPSSSAVDADKPQNTVDFRYDSWYKYPESQDNVGEASNFLTVGAMRRYGEIQVNYEGAVITIKDPSDADKKPRGKRPTYKDETGISMDRYLSRMFWATVSPNPEQGLQSVSIRNLSSLPAWSSKAASSMVSKGYMDLGANEMFKSGNVTRAECAAYLAKTFGLESQVGRGMFTDIEPMNPYLPEINAAVGAGLISGYNTTTFGASDKVSREQMAAIVMRGLKAKAGSNLSIPAASKQFSDAAKISSWAGSAVSEISTLGIMNGYPDGTFKPKGMITFNEMAVMINNLNNYLMKY